MKNLPLNRHAEIKNLEKMTNHDVKAVEYFIKKELDGLKFSHLKEWVHFGLTSQDINNTAIHCYGKKSLEHELYPAIIKPGHRVEKTGPYLERYSDAGANPWTASFAYPAG